MKKKYAGRAPWSREKQDSGIHESVVRMLNCRRYLASKGFLEEFYSNCGSHFNNDTNNISGYLIFDNGLKLTSNEFSQILSTSERDSILEKIVLKEVTFRRREIMITSFISNSPLSFDNQKVGYRRDNVIRTTYRDRNREYEFKLSVIDTTKEGVIFPINMVIVSPKRFALRYDIFLKKTIISNNDLKSFEEYREGLASAAQQDALVTYSSQTSQRKKQLQRPIKTQPIKTEFINPWETEIPESEDIIKKLNGEK